MKVHGLAIIPPALKYYEILLMVDNEHELENKEHNVLMFRLLSTGASVVSNNVAFTTNTSSLSGRQIC